MQGGQLEEDELQTGEAAQQAIERNDALASFTATPTVAAVAVASGGRGGVHGSVRAW